MRPHPRGGLLATVIGLGALGACGCTYAPRYPVEAGVAPGDGARQIQPRYPIDEAAASAPDVAASEAPASPRHASPPADSAPPVREAPAVESSDLPPPPSAALYVEDGPAPWLIEAAVRHSRPPSRLRGPARADDADDAAPRAKSGRRSHASQTTTVGKGENLYRISLRTHVPVEALAKLNGIRAPYNLTPGRVLQLPSSGGDEAETEPAEAAVRSRHGEGFREETPRELRAEKRELARQQRELAASGSGSRRERAVAPAEETRTAGVGRRRSAPEPSSPPSISPEDLLPPPTTTARREPPAAPPPAAAAPASPPPEREARTATLPSGPRPYAEAFGASASTPRARGRGGRTHEDAAAAVMAAASRHPTIGSAATAATSNGAPVDAEVSAGRGRFVWPIRGEVLSGFGPQAAGGRNDGVDLAARDGDPVHAAATGEVVYAGGAIPGFGNLVLIKHAGGYVTAYGHLSRIEVAMRQTVSQGQVVGEAGATGAVARPELHFEIRYAASPDQNARPVDPAPLLPPRAGS